MKNEGRKLAEARNNFFASQAGEKILDIATLRGGGQYLKNRIEIAFIAGWNARKNARHKKQPKIIDNGSHKVNATGELR